MGPGSGHSLPHRRARPPRYPKRSPPRPDPLVDVVTAVVDQKAQRVVAAEALAPSQEPRLSSLRAVEVLARGAQPLSRARGGSETRGAPSFWLSCFSVCGQLLCSANSSSL